MTQNRVNVKYTKKHILLRSSVADHYNELSFWKREESDLIMICQSAENYHEKFKIADLLFTCVAGKFESSDSQGYHYEHDSKVIKANHNGLLYGELNGVLKKMHLHASDLN